MKSLPIASLALVLALSGCSSSPSIEEQTKLVEYEKCLEHRENARLAVGEILDEQWKNSQAEKKIVERLTIAYGKIGEQEDEVLVAFKKAALQYCKELRP